MADHKVRFAVYPTNHAARYSMSFICVCGEPAMGYSDDEKGLFYGTCPNGHTGTVVAS
ncbi:hypothetical protein AB0K05_13025 [Nonomuraea sp. NPDC049486]|uniref:hypothetical protein n=1 Tax=Nonomuraea sp. NPDC049486 TaxID=3155773 RepID=UPI00343B5EAC